jgi:hypothetical protein
MTDKGVNYFTVVEDHFRAARGTGLFVFSSRDWVLLESWRNAGIPIEAVLRGIDVAFERRRKSSQASTIMVNSLAYCTQAIAQEAQALANTTPRTETKPPFSIENVRGFVGRNVATLRQKRYDDLAASLESLDLEIDLEQLEHMLRAIEEKMIARMLESVSEHVMSEERGKLDRDLKPYRGRMTAVQVTMLEKQFLEQRLLQLAGLPRLSLFYL